MNVVANTELDASPTDAVRCGLIMPISECDGCPSSHWAEVRTILGDAVQTITKPTFVPRLVSEADETSIIQRRIIENVYSAPIAICDLSGRNPNVMFELGMRLAFDKPVVIIKDERTDYIFDVGLIEHLNYPRDLRHGPIEVFKRDLAKKVSDTYAASLSNPSSVSFVKAFGSLKTISFDEEKVSADEAVIGMLSEMRAELARLTHARSRGPLDELDELINFGRSGSGERERKSADRSSILQLMSTYQRANPSLPLADYAANDQFLDYVSSRVRRFAQLDRKALSALVSDAYEDMAGPRPPRS